MEPGKLQDEQNKENHNSQRRVGFTVGKIPFNTLITCQLLVFICLPVFFSPKGANEAARFEELLF